MSASQFDEFDRRMRRISRRHSKLSQGYVTSVNSDGIVVAKPKRRGNGGTLRGLAILFFVLLLFKAFLFARLGPEAYDARINDLAQGTFVEKAGAWAMTPEPVTTWLAGHLSSLVR